LAALNAQRGTEDLIVKIGIHEGPCLAVMLNERQDYFGQTVNIASRVQSLSTAQEIHITGPVIESPAVATIPSARGHQADPEGSRAARYRRQDRGVRDT
jgi:class 3 adenylate cyclase